MKSLEIIKRKINEIYGFYDKWEEVEELEQVQQSLEVLEIIKNKDINIKLFKSYIKEELENDEDILECYNSHLETYRQLTLEELLKLKQWLEENKELMIMKELCFIL